MKPRVKSRARTNSIKFSLFSAYLLLLMSGTSIAVDEITGQVTATGNNEVIVKISPASTGQNHPKADDKVNFWVEIPGFDELVDGGVGTVSRVEKETVYVRTENSESLLKAKAVIQASGLRTVSLTDGLTPERKVMLMQLFMPNVDTRQHSDNSSCLQEQWCYSDNPMVENKGCSAIVGLCPGFVIENKFPDPWYEKTCSELWGNLRTEDWKVIEHGRPCELPIPPAIQNPVFTQQRAICIADKSCNESRDFAQEVCKNRILECAWDPSRLSPTKRAMCRTDLHNLEGVIDKPTAYHYEPAQCLR